MNNTEITLDRRQILEYCLKNGTGIVYGNSESAETTQQEIEAAKRNNRNPRYVQKSVIDSYMTYQYPEQVQYAIDNNVDLCDFDEWQAIQYLLFSHTNPKDPTIPFEIARKINSALWEIDISPYDLCPTQTLPCDYDYIPMTPELLDKIDNVIINEDTDAHKFVYYQIGDITNMATTMQIFMKVCTLNVNIRKFIDSGEPLKIYICRPDTFKKIFIGEIRYYGDKLFENISVAGLKEIGIDISENITAKK